MRRLTQEEFIRRVKDRYGDKFDLSLTIYTNRRTYVKYICPKHGIREQVPDVFLRYGCSECNKENRKDPRTIPLEVWIERFKEKHGDKYDYSKAVYKNADTKIDIICPIHGLFKQSPYEHRKSGCPKCAGKNKTTEDFIKAAIAKHGNKYDYSLSEYTGAFNKIKIICPEHGVFEQLYENHVILGTDCPQCALRKSKGEEELKKIFNKYNLKFTPQKTFEKCRYKKLLRFDFYLEEENILVEYDGIQHYQPVSFGGNAEINFSETVIRDKIKDEFCLNNNIKLVRFSYKDFNNLEELVLKSCVKN